MLPNFALYPLLRLAASLLGGENGSGVAAPVSQEQDEYVDSPIHGAGAPSLDDILVPAHSPLHGADRTPSYISRPDLQHVTLETVWQKPDAKLAGGVILVSPLSHTPRAVQIFDSVTHDLIYMGPVIGNGGNPGKTHNFNFNVHELNGKPVLAFWMGTLTKTYGKGRNYILDQGYNLIANFTAPNESDLHEFQIHGGSSALLSVYETAGPLNLTSLRGPEDASLLNGCIVDWDLNANRTLFSWCAQGNGWEIDDSHAEIYAPRSSRSRPWDAMHLNSIDKDATGSYLLSMRHDHTLRYVGPDGQVKWRLGGRRCSFRTDGQLFQWQHDARFRGEEGLSAAEIAKLRYRRISLFANGAWEKGFDAHHSKGLLIELDMVSMRAKIVRTYENPNDIKILAKSQGNLEFLNERYANVGSSNVLLNYGKSPYFAEFAEDGTPLWLVKFVSAKGSRAGHVDNYRTYKKQWRGFPTSDPTVKVFDGKAYVSWNGATEVRSYRLLEGRESGVWTSKTKFERTGFESSVSVSPDHWYLMIIAYDADGKELGRSKELSRYSRRGEYS